MRIPRIKHPLRLVIACCLFAWALEGSPVQSRADMDSFVNGIFGLGHLGEADIPPTDLARYRMYARSRLRMMHDRGINMVLAAASIGSTPLALRQLQVLLDEANHVGIEVVADWWLGARLTGPRSEYFYNKGQDAMRAEIETVVNALKNYPALLGYYGFDEPESGEIANLKLAYEAFQERDPAHPMLGAFGYWQISDIKSYLAVPHPERMAIWIDLYYLTFGNPPGDLRYAGVDYVQHIDAVTDVVPPEVPVWLIYRAWGAPLTDDSGGRGPYPNELKMQAYLAIAHGVKGIMPFRFNHLLDLNPDPHNWQANSANSRFEEVAAISRVVNAMGPALMRLRKVGPISSVVGGGSPYYSNGEAVLYEDRGADLKYVFLATRDLGATSTMTVTLDESQLGYLPCRVVEVASGAAVLVTVTGGTIQFRYDIPPAEGRLFRIAGADPRPTRPGPR